MDGDTDTQLPLPAFPRGAAWQSLTEKTPGWAGDSLQPRSPLPAPPPFPAPLGHWDIPTRTGVERDVLHQQPGKCNHRSDSSLS